ncbi:unnamed protein product [Didymodactylos carnosus]|uniref:Uncharacterized protein n=1 Tax=Didymodactylos carnosus TaxID=1234261 RepID=A0A815CX28_9BILA|nr:unnamed protein product [Didymodactylos carnosus]CAF1289687.1 unnamed protein product [Didymodactylos carnosus]CAF4074653.1 unnamed protein product [Didymodactylos carnosus]CAF4094492.1 unnamed protein product [Didymodactylos carnosus]
MGDEISATTNYNRKMSATEMSLAATTNSAVPFATAFIARNNTNDTTAAVEDTATTSVSRAAITSSDEEKNVEIFSLVWLDKDVSNTTEENLETQKKLMQIINFFKKFNDISSSEQYNGRRRQLEEDEKIIFIVSGGSYAKEIVPRIYDLPQIIAIYTYCRDKVVNEEEEE